MLDTPLIVLQKILSLLVGSRKVGLWVLLPSLSSRSLFWGFTPLVVVFLSL